MESRGKNISKPPIVYSCYFNRSMDGEQFASEHTLSFTISGTMRMNDGSREHLFHENEFRFIKRNQLVKFIKEPVEKVPFKSISIYFDQKLLKDISVEYDITSEKAYGGDSILKLQASKLLRGYIESLMPYEQVNEALNQDLLQLKQKEAVLILVKEYPALQDLLFDFSEPGKVDLEAFMNRNYHFNVDLKRFAYLTGRSLATFKRDFQKVFHQTPSRWLMQRRLQEARYLMKEKSRAPSDVYLDVGFRDFSHFSFAFKKQFGVAPSRLQV